MLSPTNIISDFIAIIHEYRKSKEENTQVASLLYKDDHWSISFQPGSAERDIYFLCRSFLEYISPRCQEDIPDDILLSHLALLAPQIPIDLLSVIQKILSSSLTDTDTVLNDLKEALTQTEKRDADTCESEGEWSAFFDTHIGLRKSQLGQTNQDFFYLDTDGYQSIFIVADGISVSSAGSGNLASNIAINVIDHIWKEHKIKLIDLPEQEITEFLISMLNSANYNICETSKQLAKNGLENDIPMGTTIVVAYAYKDRVTLLSLGDSRIYLLNEGGPILLTGDHNVRGERLRLGHLLEDYDGGNALMRYLGYFNDKYEASLPKPEIRHFRILPYERLLLCSDGYTDYVSHQQHEICLAITEATQDHLLHEGCWNLVRQANRNGGGDNITVILAEYSPNACS